MPTIAKKTLPLAALLCTAALGACAAVAGPASAAASSTTATTAATATTGATAAPSGGSSAPSTGQPNSPSLQEGVALATWFGPGLFGRHTACGQLLTKQLVGVANRTLPCGTLIDFSYAGHQVTVPVVDRGPYAANGADWDLTLGAARLLKMGGTADVDAKIVGHLVNSPELGQPVGHSSSRAHKPVPPTATGPSGGVEAG
jgi:rare lipoprotein A (peptidoglycan hydrolase)